MSADVLSGVEAARKLLDEVRNRVALLARSPRLAVIRAGEEAASAQYVRSIRKVAGKAGIDVDTVDLPAGASFATYVAAVLSAAEDPRVTGVQIQKPIPEGRHTSEVMERVGAAKDVEGIHPENLGLLLLGRPRFVPCTPGAVLRLLGHHGIDVKGRRVVVIGRSDIVGKPLTSLLLSANATVTVCHTVTADLPAEVARAEIIVAAAGSPELVRAAWISKDAVVVDVGHHVLADGRTVGDVEGAARERAKALSPVPGGVGPLTVALLLSNVVDAFTS